MNDLSKQLDACLAMTNQARGYALQYLQALKQDADNQQRILTPGGTVRPTLLTQTQVNLRLVDCMAVILATLNTIVLTLRQEQGEDSEPS